MKINITYHTKYGNGKKCVDYLNGILAAKGHETAVFSVLETKPDALPPADLYIFSAPTHIGKPSGKMKKFLKKAKLPEGAKFACIGTYNTGKKNAVEKMEAMLGLKNLTKNQASLKLRVTGIKGPLEEDYKKKLEEFASNIG